LNSSAEGRELQAGDGRRITLAALIKSGGAGSVYRVRGDALVVAKLYHPTAEIAVYERKVAAMLALTPSLPELVDGGTRYVQIAWPLALLRDARGSFVGYLMPAVDVSSTSELECILQEKQARSLGLPTGLGAKITLAANLANVIAELHRQQHRVVDLKPVNLRFYPKSLYMAMLDCDGFSIQGKGERFEAPQFTVDYLAPEFQRGGLTAIGEEQQDRFALAVIVFQLLNFGIHPFTGRPASERVPTDVPARIAARLYAYGLKPNTQLLPSLVSGHEAMPADLRVLFDRAFEGAGNARPSALEWGALLRTYAQRASQKLSTCTQVREHQHFAGMAFAACARAALLAKTAKSRGQSLPGAAARAGAPAPGVHLRTGFGRKGLKPNLPAFRPRPPARAPVFAMPTPPPPPVFPGYGYTPRARPARQLGLKEWAIALVFGAVLFAAIVPKNNSTPSAPPPIPVQPPTPGIVGPEGWPSQLMRPIAVDFDSATIVGPPNFRQILETRDAVRNVALGSRSDDRSSIDAGMAALQRAIPAAGSADAARRAEYQARFGEFLPRALSADPAVRLSMMRQLALKLQDEPYDAESACEWSWLARLSGETQFARNGFLRTLWADPQYYCGWLGYGALADETEISFGALIMAERLQQGEAKDYQARDQLVEAGFGSEAELQRWRILDARARVRAAKSRNQAVPPEIQARADQLLTQSP